MTLLPFVLPPHSSPLPLPPPLDPAVVPRIDPPSGTPTALLITDLAPGQPTFPLPPTTSPFPTCARVLCNQRTPPRVHIDCERGTHCILDSRYAGLCASLNTELASYMKEFQGLLTFF